MLQIGAMGNLGDLRGRYRHGNPNRPPSGLDRVEDQIGHDPVEQILVALQEGVPAFHSNDGIGTAIGMRPNQPYHGTDYGMKIEGGEVGSAHPGKVEELTEQPAQPVAL